MDERIWMFKAGQPIPEWDSNHRLPISGNVSPICADDGTVFRINALYMDVSDQPFSSRQWLAGASLLAFGTMVVFIFFSAIILFDGSFSTHFEDNLIGLAITIAGAAGFGYIVLRYGRDEFFALTRRTIRFHRGDQKIYVMRRRRLFAKPKQGDICWEIDWNERTVFCVHKGPSRLVERYHIRGYEVNGCGIVQRAFAIGKCWVGADELKSLLAQWNFYCAYMRAGPEGVPHPMLYLSEDEGPCESFLHCMYETGRSSSGASRLFNLPSILVLACFRILSIASCRAPIWPPHIEDRCSGANADLHAQPSGVTPIGWARTIQAKQNNSYPFSTQKEVEDWSGLSEAENALLWASAKSPLNYVES